MRKPQDHEGFMDGNAVIVESPFLATCTGKPQGEHYFD